MFEVRLLTHSYRSYRDERCWVGKFLWLHNGDHKSIYVTTTPTWRHVYLLRVTTWIYGCFECSISQIGRSNSMVDFKSRFCNHRTWSHHQDPVNTRFHHRKRTIQSINGKTWQQASSWVFCKRWWLRRSPLQDNQCRVPIPVLSVLVLLGLSM